MKKANYVLSGLVMLLTSCTTLRNEAVANSLLIGKWQQPNVTLDLNANGNYTYLYKEDGYGNKQSGKYSYFTAKDSVVLYGFYPHAYTAESKNLRWSVRQLTPDSLAVYVHKPTVILDGDTLNMIGGTIDTFTRK